MYFFFFYIWLDSLRLFIKEGLEIKAHCEHVKLLLYKHIKQLR